MTDFVLPPYSPTDVEWKLVDYSAVFSSPTSGATRTVSRGQRWQCTLRFINRIAEERAALMAFSAAIRGKSNRVYLGDISSAMRGSGLGTELLSNPDWSSGTTGWTGVHATLNARKGRAKLIVNSTTPTVQLNQNVSLVSGASYLVRGLIRDGLGTSGLTAGAQLADVTTGFGFAYSATRGLITAVRTAAGTGTGIATPATISAVTGYAVGNYLHVDYASCQRCALVTVSGPSPTGSTCTIRGLPVSTTGIALAGDMIEIAGELKRLVEDVDSDGSGNAYIEFEPALRSATIADGAPVAFVSPLGKFVLSEDLVWQSRPAGFSDFQFTFVEAS